MEKLLVQKECIYDGILNLSPFPTPCMALAGGNLQLEIFIRAETPTPTELLVRFHPALSTKPYKAELTADLEDRLIRIPRFKLPDRPTPVFFPDRIELQMRDFRYKSRLPTFELLSTDKFFEYITTLQLERLGFECNWLSRRDPRFPNIRGIFKLKPPPEGEVFHIEGTIQKPYDSQKFYADFGKFKSEKDAFRPRFTRLLIVTLYPDLTEDVSRKVVEFDKQVSLITYPTLVQLVKQVERGIIERVKAYELLQRPGVIRISPRITVSEMISGNLVLAYAFKLCD